MGGRSKILSSSFPTTLPETKSQSLENGWLEDYILSFWGLAWRNLAGANLLLVSGRVHFCDP